MEGEIQVKIIPQIIYLFTGCACAVAFLFLILLDLARAWKKKAYWVQGEALVLTALTIQLLNLLDDSNVSVSGNAIKKQYEVALLFEKQLLIDSGRLVLCVFIAYLLPGMARAGSASSWGNIGALSINVVVHMVSELYFLRRKSIAKLMKHREPLDINDYEFLWQEAAGSSRIWFIVSNVTISVAMILLMLLLGCAVLAGKSIRNVATQKILSALTQNAPNSDQVDSSSIDEHHVLKSWILAYTCQPDYIMARSVLSSSAGLVVTICVLLCIVKWGFLHGDIGLHRYYGLNKFKNTVLVIQILFVLLGWSVICWRWVTAVVYFPRSTKYFHVEDFWTRRIVELQEQSRAPLFPKNRKDKKSCTQILMESLRLRHCFLKLLLFLQRVLVLMSMVCWIFSEWSFGYVIKKILGNRSTDSRKYMDILECARMPAESGESLWRATENAIKKTEDRMNKALGQGADACQELTDLMAQTSEKNKDGGKFIKPSNCCKLAAAEDFSWKMTAVSLIEIQIIFVFLEKPKSDPDHNYDKVGGSVNAYFQAWEFMDFVDSRSGPEISLPSKAADKQMDLVRNHWIENKLSEIAALLINTIEKKHPTCNVASESQACNAVHHDSKDWMTESANLALCQTWEKISELRNDRDKIQRVRTLLADIITICMKEKLPGALRDGCTEMAANLKEEQAFKTVSIAAKARGVMQSLNQIIT